MNEEVVYATSGGEIYKLGSGVMCSDAPALGYSGQGRQGGRAEPVCYPEPPTELEIRISLARLASARMGISDRKRQESK